MPLKFTQIITGSWRSNPTSLNITVYGLTKAGEVYKFVQSKNGWVPLSMSAVAPGISFPTKKEKRGGTLVNESLI